jgi:glycosyltransferase involved in cell wall biosynthesis
MNLSKSELLYPKTLIIGLPFNNKTGGGITMSNLFRNWPKENIALASAANIMITADFSICSKHYQLSYNGKLHPFPLNIFLPKIKDGPVEFTCGIQRSQQNQLNGGKFRKLYKIIYKVLTLTGTYNLLYKLKIDSQFKEWIRSFQPDIIYSQLGSLEMVRFVNMVQTFANVPLVIHIMDDWPGLKKRPALLNSYWQNKFNNEFRVLIEKSSVLLSIGNEMSEEYLRRYNREFIPFHNPIELDRWLQFSKTDYSYNDEFSILYAGRIGLGMKESIFDLVRVIKDLASKGERIKLEILSPDISELDGRGCFCDYIRWTKPIEYSELPRKFSEADLLVIPIDFDQKSIDFLKFSYQTKISEYMISGTPILVYGPEEVATVKYAMKTKWAYVVNTRSDYALVNAILELKSSRQLRNQYGITAKELSAAKEDALFVREEFRKCLVDSLYS